MIPDEKNSMASRYTTRIIMRKKMAYVLFIYFPTILDQGAPSFRNHFRQKKVYLYRLACVLGPIFNPQKKLIWRKIKLL